MSSFQSYVYYRKKITILINYEYKKVFFEVDKKKNKKGSKIVEYDYTDDLDIYKIAVDLCEKSEVIYE